MRRPQSNDNYSDRIDELNAQIDELKLQSKAASNPDEKERFQTEIRNHLCKRRYYQTKLGIAKKERQTKEKERYQETVLMKKRSGINNLEAVQLKATQLMHKAKSEEEKKIIQEQLYYTMLRYKYS